jgi:two-component system, NarL family, nitrate/nitrite response regulator NarL
VPANRASHESLPSANPDRRIGILIASEIRLLGEGLARALARERSVCVYGYCADLAEAVAKVAELRPDVVLLNAALETGGEVIARIRAMGPQVRVVALAIAEEPENVIGWAEAGAAGYIPSTTALRDLAPLLVDIMRGEQPCSARVAASLLERVRTVARAGNGNATDASRPVPTAREMQILEMIGNGLSNKEIARQLNIGLATTKSHVHNLLGKLGLQRRSQAATWIRGRGFGPNASLPPRPPV